MWQNSLEGFQSPVCINLLYRLPGKSYLDYPFKPSLYIGIDLRDNHDQACSLGHGSNRLSIQQISCPVNLERRDYQGPTQRAPHLLYQLPGRIRLEHSHDK
jgi:hypothetical protein